MRTLVYIGASLDNFIARKDGDFDWLSRFANEEAIHSYKEFMNRIDAIIIGRGTFEKVLSFPAWPYEKEVFVLSTTIKQVPYNIKKQRVSVLSMKPAELLSHLENSGHTNVYVDGGKVIQDFLKEDLIDELIISKAPILIGSGIPLFSCLDVDLSFRHIRTNVQDNGLVRSYYERERPQ